MTGDRTDFYIETLALLEFMAISVFLADKYPEPLGIAFMFGFAAVWWPACGSYFGRWDFPRVEAVIGRVA